MTRRRWIAAAALAAGLLLCGGAVAVESGGATRPRHPEDLKYPPLRFSPPKPSEVALRNGLRTWVLEDPALPLVEGVLVIEAGGIDDPERAPGLAEAVGEVVRTGGTLSRTPEEVDEEIDRLGAELEVGVGDELTTIEFSSLSGDFERLLALVSDLVRNPAFRKDRLDLKRTQMREEIRRRWENPGDVAALRLGDLVYGEKSRWARRPSEVDLNQIGQAPAREFHARRYVPARTWLGLAGDVSPAQARRAIEKLFGSWRGAAGPLRAHEEPLPPAEPAVYWIERDVAQAAVAFAHRGARRLGPDHHSLQVLNLVLGAGQSSRLFKEVRSARGLAYGVQGEVDEGYDPALFRVALRTDPARAGEALAASRQVLEGMRAAPPADQEIRVARERETQSFVFNFARASGVVSQRVYLEALGYPSDYLERYLEQIAAVTAEQVHRAARDYIRPERLVALVVGPAAAAESLRAAGFEPRRIELEPGR
jgi:zinc protease